MLPSTAAPRSELALAACEAALVGVGVLFGGDEFVANEILASDSTGVDVM
jgi:hypothetical protein